MGKVLHLGPAFGRDQGPDIFRNAAIGPEEKADAFLIDPERNPSYLDLARPCVAQTAGHGLRHRLTGG